MCPERKSSGQLNRFLHISQLGKTKLVVFTNKRIIRNFTPPKFFGKRIPRSDSVKVLGLTVDSKVNFSMHFDNVIQKATGSLWHCRRAFGLTWGLSPRVLKWIYTSIIRPRLSYAAIIWWPRCNLTTSQLKLAKLQRLALIGITSAMRAAPTAALEALLNIEPLHIYIEAEARSSALRMKLSKSLIVNNSNHSRIWQKMIDQSPELDMPCDSIIPKYRFEKSFSINLPNRND